eukprot:scaffold24543_cov195-Amphora_coffeaeformis.AAC.19
MQNSSRSIFRSTPSSLSFDALLLLPATANDEHLHGDKDCRTMSTVSSCASLDTHSSYNSSSVTPSMEPLYQQQQRRYVSIDTEAVYPSNGQRCLAMPTFDDDDDDDDDLLDRRQQIMPRHTTMDATSSSTVSCSGMMWPSLQVRFTSRTEFEEY